MLMWKHFTELKEIEHYTIRHTFAGSINGLQEWPFGAWNPLVDFLKSPLH